VLSGTRRVEISIIAKSDNSDLLACEINAFGSLREEVDHVRVELPLDTTGIPRTTPQQNVVCIHEIIGRCFFSTLLRDVEILRIVLQVCHKHIHNVLRVAAAGGIDDMERCHGGIVVQRTSSPSAETLALFEAKGILWKTISMLKSALPPPDQPELEEVITIGNDSNTNLELHQLIQEYNDMGQRIPEDSMHYGLIICAKRILAELKEKRFVVWQEINPVLQQHKCVLEEDARVIFERIQRLFIRKRIVLR
jgi:hypothetical protein